MSVRRDITIPPRRDGQDNNFQRGIGLAHVLLTAVNIIRGVRATLGSPHTRATCVALDEPKQTSASESETRRPRGRRWQERSIKRERERERGGGGEQSSKSPTNPPPHALTPSGRTTGECASAHHRREFSPRFGLPHDLASNRKYTAEQKRALRNN